MDDRTSHVVNHGDDDRLDVVLGVAGIVLKGVILLYVSQYSPVYAALQADLPIHHGPGSVAPGT